MSVYPHDFRDDRDLYRFEEDDTQPMDAIDNAGFPDWKTMTWHGEQWHYWVEESPDGMWTVQDLVCVKRGYRFDDVMRAYIDARAYVEGMPSTDDIQAAWMRAFSELACNGWHEDDWRKLDGIEAMYTMRWSR